MKQPPWLLMYGMMVAPSRAVLWGQKEWANRQGVPELSTLRGLGVQ